MAIADCAGTPRRQVHRLRNSQRVRIAMVIVRWDHLNAAAETTATLYSWRKMFFTIDRRTGPQSRPHGAPPALIRHGRGGMQWPKLLFAHSWIEVERARLPRLRAHMRSHDETE